MSNSNLIPRAESIEKICDHRHRAMATASAANRDRDVGLPFTLGSRQVELDQALGFADEGLGVGLRQDEVGHGLLQAGLAR